MDNWQEDQFKRMEVCHYAVKHSLHALLTCVYFVQRGGNKRFKEFLEQYTPASIGGYEIGMSKDEKYGSWAAEQYKERVR